MEDNFNYTLNICDLIEVEDLKSRKSKNYNYNIYFFVVFLSLLLLSFFRIKDHNFLVFNNYFKQLNSNRLDTDYIQDMVWYLLLVILYFGNLFPRYNPLVWWNVKKEYRENFVQQELKSISISKDGITIVSENFRESRKWQNFSKVLEKKQIFLLFHSRDKETVIIPKRIFNDETKLSIFRDFISIIQN